MAELFSDDPKTIDPSKNYLEELVGENKKFASPEELARGKAESDFFIERITAENAQLRDEVNKRKSLEEIRDQLVALRETTPTPNSPSNHDDERDRANLFDQSKVDQLVSQKFQELSREEKEKANLESVIEVLKGKFGGGFQSVVQARADELGLGQKYLTDLAKVQPKAFLALVGAEGSKETPGSVTTARTNPTALTTKRGWSYYEDIRKKDPVRYNSLHGEMLKHLTEQGDDFYKN
jgi:hypothetical protein